jgi:hypothetical protein
VSLRGAIRPGQAQRGTHGRLILSPTIGEVAYHPNPTCSNYVRPWPSFRQAKNRAGRQHSEAIRPPFQALAQSAAGHHSIQRQAPDGPGDNDQPGPASALELL